MKITKSKIFLIALIFGIPEIVLFCTEPSLPIILNRFAIGSLGIMMVGGLSIIKWRNSFAGAYTLHGNPNNVLKAGRQLTDTLGIHPHYGKNLVICCPKRNQVKRIIKICKANNVSVIKNNDITITR